MPSGELSWFTLVWEDLQAGSRPNNPTRVLADTASREKHQGTQRDSVLFPVSEQSQLDQGPTAGFPSTPGLKMGNKRHLRANAR